MKREGWYERKKYPHFDHPLDFAAAKEIVTSPIRVQRHAFLPFLHFKVRRRRFKIRRGVVEIREKTRVLSMPSHVDGYIFGYYAKQLSEAYEKVLAAKSLQNCVLAYRTGNGSNIDFANSAFADIAAREECVAIALDLEKFFDNIDHDKLKKNWQAVLGVSRLSPDHYAVFRAITRYAHVDRDQCYARLGIKPKGPVPRPICSGDQFRKIVRGDRTGLPNLIETNRNPYGIPQGSQISAVLSNIYMLEFDEEMSTIARELKGSYRRYCDDILLIAAPRAAPAIEAALYTALAKVGPRTVINSSKTERSTFTRDAAGRLTCDRPIQYLGFTFDGQNRRIRCQTLSRFWRKVTYVVRASKRTAMRSTTAPGVVFKRKIYRRFSHLGRRNLLSYARLSEKIMGTGAIKRQVRRHMQRLKSELEKPLI